MASMFSLKSGYGVKVLAVFHAIIGGIFIIVAFFLDPFALTSSGILYASFELLLLSWWLWRFPRITSFREQILPINQRRQAMTTEESEQYLRRAWWLQLFFVIVWGWICAILFGVVTNWLMVSGGYLWPSVFLLGEIIVVILGWIIGSAWIIHQVYGH